MKNLIPFDYQGKQVRTVVVDGEPWFVAKDVCEILEHSDTSVAVSRLDDDEKLTQALFVSGQNREVWCVNESGLYSLVLTSRKEEARTFKRWLTHEVLPSIRKTGGYMAAPQNYGEALRELATTWEAKQLAEAKVKELQPKADFFDAVASSKTAIQIGNVAKVLDIKGVGRNKLFEILRDKKVLNKENVPYQEFIDRGYFRVIEQKYNKPDGTVCVDLRTLVYQRGVDYIRKLVS